MPVERKYPLALSDELQRSDQRQVIAFFQTCVAMRHEQFPLAPQCQHEQVAWQVYLV